MRFDIRIKIFLFVGL